MRGAGLLTPVLALLLAAPPGALGQELQLGSATVRLGAWLHAGYATSSVEAYPEHFSIRRARLIVDWRLSDFVDGRIQPDVHGRQVTLQDAFVRFSFDPAFRLSLGQLKRAFDPFVLDSPADMSLVEWDGRIPGLQAGCARVGGMCTFSGLTTGLGLSFRDVGLRVEGRGGRLSWLATLTNGTGINQPDDNGSKSAAGRLEWHVASRLRLGGGIAFHDRSLGAPDGGTAYDGAWGVDARWGGFRDGLHVQAAVTGGENPTVVVPVGEGPATFLAAQVVGRWYRPVGGGGAEARLTAVEPLLRVGWADPERGRPASEAVLVTPGLALYVGGSSKVGVNLDVYAPDVGDTETSLKLQIWLHL